MPRDAYDDPYDPDRNERERGYDDYDDDRGYDDRRGGRDARAIRNAKSRVMVPAIGLIIVGVLGLLAFPYGVFQFFTLDAQIDAQKEEIRRNPQFTPQQKKDQLELMDKLRDVFKVAILPIYALLGLCAVVTLFGGVKMLTLGGRGWATAGAVLSFLPFTSGCCFLGLIFGIWALVVLSQPDVKAGFAARRRGAYSPPDSY